MNLKTIINTLRSKSNIDYYYYHEFSNNKLELDFNINNFTINYIIYIINSDFSWFIKYYENVKNIYITDIFIERVLLNDYQKKMFFSMVFKKLFWLKLNNIFFDKRDYLGLINFLNLNELDINRIFLENMSLEDDFFFLFNNLNWFNNLTFLNFDNNLITNNWLESIIKFLYINKIDLEYLSLIWNNISNFNILQEYLLNSNIRVLDISWNNLIDIDNLINFFKKSQSIKEVYIKNIKLSNYFLDNLLTFFSVDNRLDIFRFSLSKDQLIYIDKFKELSCSTFFDIDIIYKDYIYSTIYFKVLKNKNHYDIDNNYFYSLDINSLDFDFDNIINQKWVYLKSWINLFLFDFNDYIKIDFLLSNYNFNYIYIENYSITDENFLIFLNSINKNKNKTYKINFISIELNYFQLDYLINNFPENIFYIEVNLNKIDKNRELFITKMLKNKAFIFENMELYSKIFK